MKFRRKKDGLCQNLYLCRKRRRISIYEKHGKTVYHMLCGYDGRTMCASSVFPRSRFLTADFGISVGWSSVVWHISSFLPLERVARTLSPSYGF